MSTEVVCVGKHRELSQDRVQLFTKVVYICEKLDSQLPQSSAEDRSWLRFIGFETSLKSTNKTIHKKIINYFRHFTIAVFV